MIFHFQTGDVTFFAEDQAYFEKRFAKIEQLLGFDAGDSDSIEIWVKLTKTKYHSGNSRFEANATVHCPRGKFFAETTAEDMKQCADELKKKLRVQIESFHGKRK